MYVIKKKMFILVSVCYYDFLFNNSLELDNHFSIDYSAYVFRSPISFSSPGTSRLPSNCYLTPNDVLDALAILQFILSCGSYDILARLLYN